MKKIAYTISLGLSVLAMGFCSDKASSVAEEQQEKKTIHKNVSVAEFSELINKGKGQIVDVRTPKEWGGGVIKNAIKIDYYNSDFKKQLTSLDATKPVYVYCAAGGRSEEAAEQLKKMGFKEVYNLTGGMDAWETAGNEKVKE